MAVIVSKHSDRHGRDRIVIKLYNRLCNQCLSQLTLLARIGRGVLNIPLCDRVCQ